MRKALNINDSFRKLAARLSHFDLRSSLLTLCNTLARKALLSLNRRLLIFSFSHFLILPASAQQPAEPIPFDTLPDMRAEVDSLISIIRQEEEEAEMRAEVDTLIANMVMADFKKPKKGKSLIRPQQIIVPAALITLGAVAVANPRLCEIKYDVRDAFQRGRGDHRKAKVETWVTLGAQVLNIAFGPKCKHNLIDRMLVKATSYALLYSTMPIVNACVRERRPDGNGRHSFSSFKTANAFLAAEQTRIERGWAWGMGMYTVAAGIGVLQMYNDRAYINDVLAGAGMGILSVHAAYWLLPLERKWFGLDKDRKDKGFLVMPTYEPLTRTAGFTFTACL